MFPPVASPWSNQIFLCLSTLKEGVFSDRKGEQNQACLWSSFAGVYPCARRKSTMLIFLAWLMFIGMIYRFTLAFESIKQVLF